jgi:2-C-methyl-D-erythritol 4-phosphate cytidylyltransferase
MKVSSIIPAAGLGTRMGGIKKPYIELAGKPILAHILSVFQQCCSVDNILVVTAKGDEEHCARDIIKYYAIDKVTDVVTGGDTRQESVFNALQKLSSDTDIVVIHDAVRPFFTEGMILESIEQANYYGSAIVAVPVKDTIKEASEDGIVLKTLDRRKLWAIQTPQTFRYELIIQAHLQAKDNGIQATDDASLVEQMGFEVKLIMGSYENIKITTPDDLIVAEAILKSKAKKS